MLSIRRKCSVQGIYYYLHNFQHFHLYSTIKSPNQTYSNYLVNNLGFSEQEAHSTSTKILSKNDNYSKFSNNANSVVDFLKQHGFKDTHIKKVVSYYPKILASNVDQTLIPKFKVFQDHGFSGSSLVSLISSSPSILSKRMDPIIHDLRAILGSNDNLITFFRQVRFSMTPSSLVNLNSNIALLNNEYGVDINVIRKGIILYPSSYLKKNELFQNVLVRVEEELGIPRNSGMFLYGVFLLCNSTKEMIDSKSQLFKSFGWTQYDVSKLMRRSPNTFSVSEEKIGKKLCFLMTELGYKPDFLATRAPLLSLSLEKRLAPRHRVLLVLKEKGLLDYNFFTAAIKTEKQFLKIYIEPFKEDAPGLLELYQSSKRCSGSDAILR